MIHKCATILTALVREIIPVCAIPITLARAAAYPCVLARMPAIHWRALDMEPVQIQALAIVCLDTMAPCAKMFLHATARMCQTHWLAQVMEIVLHLKHVFVMEDLLAMLVNIQCALGSIHQTALFVHRMEFAKTPINALATKIGLVPFANCQFVLVLTQHHHQFALIMVAAHQTTVAHVLQVLLAFNANLAYATPRIALILQFVHHMEVANLLITVRVQLVGPDCRAKFLFATQLMPQIHAYAAIKMDPVFMQTRALATWIT